MENWFWQSQHQRSFARLKVSRAELTQKHYPMTSTQRSTSFQNKISALEGLNSDLKATPDTAGKIHILDKMPIVAQFSLSAPKLMQQITHYAPFEQYVIKAILALEQGPTVFYGWESVGNLQEALGQLIHKLTEIEKFYDTLGGIVGYQLTLLKLIQGNHDHRDIIAINYEKPDGTDVSVNNHPVRQSVRWGIETMREIGEIYPLGGAGDRLNLKDEVTGELLPAAQLLFCGRTLLEGLIRDLQGREYLYYKLFGKQLNTPIAIMTSHEKNNHERLIDLCETVDWFGRAKESYRFFLQPLVPMVTAEGDWVTTDTMQLCLKPGGHGAIWKIALDEGIFSWFEQQGTAKVLVRQINNPIAGTDNTLLSLAGIGSHQGKDFGFASCHRLLNTPEGMNVLKDVQTKEGYKYCITNVEYTEFKRYGIEDAPECVGSEFSRFPSNTNILFGNLKAIKEALKICPLPGLLINMKNSVMCRGPHGSVEKLAGRLESTMQNIADCIFNFSKDKLSKAECADLRTFLTYNERKKTISVVKQEFVPGESFVGTPEGCFYDVLNNYRDLLANRCGIEVPPSQTESEFIEEGPNFIAHFHPALGILYTVISQKIRKGRIAKGSELVFEIAELDILNLDLSGSLIIEADSMMGEKDVRGILIYNADACGRCTLHNVKVFNQGYGNISAKDAWQNNVSRKETLRITLQGNAEFFAEDVELVGDVHFVVPSGHRLVVYQRQHEIAWHFEKISRPTWKWDYTFDDEDHICLEKIKNARRT